MAQIPVITVRFGNPKYICTTQTYSLDVLFQSDTPNKQLHLMNVRFYYNDDVLEFLSLGEYATGYGIGNPNPPQIFTSSPSAGWNKFRFTGPYEAFNGGVQRSSGTVYISTTGWTKLFNVSFHVDDPEVFDFVNFCPSIVWDKKEDMSGGFFTGEGVAITIVGTPNTDATENVVQFNWQYDGVPGDPFGYPIENNCLGLSPVMYLPDVESVIPGIVNVPVSALNFDDVTSFDIAFEYDTDALTFVSHTSNAIFTEENGLLILTDSLVAGNKRKISMHFTGNPISLSDSAQLAEISFTLGPGSSELNWILGCNTCRFKGLNDLPLWDYPLQDHYLNGSVEMLDAPVTRIDSVVANNGGFVTCAVRVVDFKNIHEGTLTLDYDPAVLQYYHAVPNYALEGYFTASAGTPGRLEMEWSSISMTLPDESTLAYLSFSYLGGSTPLVWYDSGTSCQFIDGNMDVPLYDLPSEYYYINGFVTVSNVVWTGEESNDWHSNLNWENNIIPDQFTNVVIDPALSRSGGPSFTGDFTLGVHCKNLTLLGNTQMTVTGNFTINPGHTFEISENSMLQIGGSWTNSGTFNPGNGTIEFMGENDAAVANGVPPGNYVAAYLLSTFNEDMTLIPGGNPGPAGNDAHSDVNLGFSFHYLGTDYSMGRINTNGWLSFDLSGDDAISYDNTILFEAIAPSNTLAPWWDNLIADEISAVSYVTTGTVPNRVFIAEWKNIAAYSYGSSTRLNFQVKLYETSNVIEFCYGDIILGTQNPLESASIGIKNGSGGPGNFLEATHNSINLPLPCLRAANDWPMENFRFTPPVENDIELFHHVIVSKTSGELAIQKDTYVSGIE